MCATPCLALLCLAVCVCRLRGIELGRRCTYVHRCDMPSRLVVLVALCFIVSTPLVGDCAVEPASIPAPACALAHPSTRRNPKHPTGKQLLQEEFIQKNPAWVKELELMLKMKKKAEIQVCTHARCHACRRAEKDPASSPRSDHLSPEHPQSDTPNSHHPPTHLPTPPTPCNPHLTLSPPPTHPLPSILPSLSAIQALSAFGFQYVTEVYLPRKLEKGDWI